jgi:hypothetical protein
MKYGKYKFKFIYAPKPSAGVTDSVFTKLTLVQDFFSKTTLPNFMRKRDDVALFLIHGRTDNCIYGRVLHTRLQKSPIMQFSQFVLE